MPPDTEAVHRGHRGNPHANVTQVHSVLERLVVRLYSAGSALVKYSTTPQFMPVKSPSCDWSHMEPVALLSGHGKPYLQVKNWTATHHLSSQNEGVGLPAWGWVCLSGESSKLLCGFGALINVPVEGVGGDKSAQCIFVPSSTL